MCYCDGYGVCFGGKQEYNAWFDDRMEVNRIEVDLGLLDKLDLPSPETETQKTRYRKLIEDLKGKMNHLKWQAFERGTNPKHRALEVGRPWKEGDGF